MSQRRTLVLASFVARFGFVDFIRQRAELRREFGQGLSRDQIINFFC